MATFKIVLADPSTGKCEQREVEGDAAKVLLGKKIGDTVPGDKFDLKGKTLLITGGSDYCGFPMRSDLPGTLRKRILVTKSVGFRGGLKGMRKRKTVAGNTIHPKIHQINLKIQVKKAAPAKQPAPKKAAPSKKPVAKKVEPAPKKTAPAKKPAAKKKETSPKKTAKKK